MLVMIAVACACPPAFFTRATIARREGAVLPGYCVACAASIVMTAQQHEVRATSALASQGVVKPLTVLALLVARVRARRERGRT